MTTRKPHRKSRNGCVSCKHRKVKCDETRPTCRNCTRRDEQCVYNDAFTSSLSPSSFGSRHTLSARNGAPSSSAASSFSASSSSQMSIGGVTLERPRVDYGPDGPHDHQDLKLMWHYVVDIATKDTRDPLVQDIRQRDVVEEAFKFQFVMDGLLAMAALHYHWLGDVTCDWTRLARIKRDLGLRTYVRILEYIDESNCKAIFLFSTIVPVLFMASRPPNHDIPGTAEAVLEHALFLFSLQRGIATVMEKSAHLCLRDSRVCQMMSRASQVKRHPLSHSTTDALARLKEQCETDKSSDPSQFAIFGAAISELERILQCLSPDGIDVDIDAEFVFSWPITAGGHYAELLQNRHSAALAILAFYGAVVHELRSLWFINDWGNQIVHVACASLDSSWAPATEWARKQVTKTTP